MNHLASNLLTLSLATALVSLAHPNALAQTPIVPTATIALDAQQKQVLAAATAWKVEVANSIPYEPRQGCISIEKDCEELLRRAGWNVVRDDAPIILKIGLSGSALSSEYNATPSTRYSGAQVWIEASIVSADSPDMALATFSTARGDVPAPWSISGGYLNPDDAPYGEAYRKCVDFFTQLLSVVHATKGAGVTYACRQAQTSVDIDSALFALIQATGDREFVPPLIAEVTAASQSNANIVACLGSLGDPRAVEPLCKVLMDAKGNVWIPAVEALGKLGGSTATAHLRGALLGTAGDPGPIATALRALQWAPETVQEKVAFDLALNEPNAIQAVRAEAGPVLIDMVKAETWNASAAIALLGQFRETRAVPTLSDVLLGTAHEHSLRLAAAKALTDIGGEQVVDPLVMALMSDQNSGVRAACATGLGQGSGDQAARPLAEVAMNDEDDMAVQAAIEALGQLKSKTPGTLDSLTKNLHHANATIRLAAANGLKSVGDAAAVPAIRDRLDQENDNDVRQGMLMALTELGAEAAAMPFDTHLRMLAKQGKWEQMRSFLNEQPIEKVIESLKLDEELVRKVARFTLARRTGKYDLRHYDDWKQWWEAHGGTTADTLSETTANPETGK